MSAKNVVIVESPAKATTIEKFLGKDYKVVASYGHVRDLPKSRLAVDVDNNFEPEYIIPPKSRKTVKALTEALAKATTVYLATDYDREGEAIAWHILAASPPKSGQTTKRITFTEITESAIKQAIKQPRPVDQNLVDAQQARRVLDRLVGYRLSPVLWKKVRSGLSAGRVQSVALKLIVDREREIKAFEPVEYWTIAAELDTDKPETFTANLSKIKSKKAELSHKKNVQDIEKALRQAKFTVADIDQKEVKRSPAPPFITSSLQQEASRKLGYSGKKTMMIAQQLYEGIKLPGGNVGLITYMRTDSFSLSAQALTEAQAVIKQLYGASYTSGPRYYKKKVRGAQEAHEAIRPTSFERQPETLKAHLSAEQYKLYRLIWQRALASQMTEARYLQRGADIAAGQDYLFRATGRSTLFDGFTRVYFESRDDGEDERDSSLPELTKGQALTLRELKSEQHFTEPPPRFTEASLIKKLEENGIGRPSTYAPTISTIVSRGYIKIENRQLIPQDVGFCVTALLEDHFPFVVSEKFTAEMEDKLDDVAEGETKWQPVIRAFYEPMEELIEKADIPSGSYPDDGYRPPKIPDIPTEEACDKCGKPMVIKTGRFGQFMACSGFPDCKNAKPIRKTIGVECPDCGGDLIEKKTKRGRLFYGCSSYPSCQYATWQKPVAPAKSGT